VGGGEEEAGRGERRARSKLSGVGLGNEKNATTEERGNRRGRRTRLMAGGELAARHTTA
jgi:hypothetical protein